MQRFAQYRPTQQTGFYQSLRRDISLHLQTRHSSGRANTAMFVKMGFCLALFAVAYYGYATVTHYGYWLGTALLLGISSFLLGVNIAHDALHHTIFRNKTLNHIAGFTFDLTGISSYTWQLKHNTLHHRFPNVNGIDFDIEAGPLLRLSPAQKHRWFHAAQHWYAPLIYCCFSLWLTLASDWLILSTNRRHIDGKKHPAYIYILLPLLKLAYLTYMIAVPAILLPFSFTQILGGFLLMHALLSLLMALVLLPAHLFEATAYATPNQAQHIHQDWAQHQVATTLDFAVQSRIAHFLFGGFNTNVIHHLFPRICHIHYRTLAPLIAAKAAQYHIPYHRTSLIGAICTHFAILKKLGHKHYA